MSHIYRDREKDGFRSRDQDDSRRDDDRKGGRYRDPERDRDRITQLPLSASLVGVPTLPAGSSTVAQVTAALNQSIAVNKFTGQPYSTRYFGILAKRRTLPVFEYQEKFMEMLDKNKILVLVGETGSGKTTQVSGHLVCEATNFLMDMFGHRNHLLLLLL